MKKHLGSVFFFLLSAASILSWVGARAGFAASAGGDAKDATLVDSDQPMSREEVKRAAESSDPGTRPPVKPTRKKAPTAPVSGDEQRPSNVRTAGDTGTL